MVDWPKCKTNAQMNTANCPTSLIQGDLCGSPKFGARSNGYIIDRIFGVPTLEELLQADIDGAGEIVNQISLYQTSGIFTASYVADQYPRIWDYQPSWPTDVSSWPIDRFAMSSEPEGIRCVGRIPGFVE